MLRLLGLQDRNATLPRAQWEADVERSFEAVERRLPALRLDRRAVAFGVLPRMAWLRALQPTASLQVGCLRMLWLSWVNPVNTAMQVQPAGHDLA